MHAAVGLHPVAEDDGCRDLVDDLSAIAGRVAGLVEDLVGGDGGEALVEEFDREVGARAEVVGELVDLSGPGRDLTGHMEWVADNNAGDVVFANETEDAAEVLASGFAPDGEERLRSVAERIRKGDANARLAYIQRHHATLAHWASLSLSDTPQDECPLSQAETSPGLIRAGCLECLPS
jgi:hypothetical protein